ncbi:MAG TPA: zinc ribbon domain-containing protein [Geminicoccus sp.]|uniref:zinc ribbon domain-containing protein n=1 Tax=Geminicoccus sp. TaxID=2024832 RepID=UPI002E31F24F|nr:zinc ribbon domain-containing protein [Geminicoccus sp.]HEX2528254.1 zinc ribbon domain-containing protein [Geminicoccus sp.]
MPLYTYDCADHGIFREWSAMSESDQPRACPSCGEPARRAMARPMLGRSAASERPSFACDVGDIAPSARAGGGCGCGAGGCIH